MTETKTNPTADFASLFLKGVERAAELQKKSLDTAAQLNAEAIATYKKSPQVVPALPNVFDLAAKAFEGYVDAQKNVIDQMVKQTTAMIETAQVSGNSAQTVAEAFAKNIEQSIGRTVELQKQALDMVAHQVKATTSK
jgi:hypothetical protein